MKFRIGGSPLKKMRVGWLAALLSVLLVIAVVGQFLPSSALPVSTNLGKHVPNQVIVRFNPLVPSALQSALHRSMKARVVKKLAVTDTYLVEVPAKLGVGPAIIKYEASRYVRYAEQNGFYKTTAAPNDPDFGQLYGLHNTGQLVNQVRGYVDADIDAPDAWDLTTGSASVVVAVTDTGVDYTHRDLAPNIWSNPGESGNGKEANGVDDDRNGFVDDNKGWDFAYHSNDPMDVYGHGTHVAGTIGAVGNDGRGITGVAWDVSIMPVKVLSNLGSGTWADVADGFVYASRNGAKVVNVSLGGIVPSDLVLDAILQSPNTLFSISAGNNGLNVDGGGQYPCTYPAANIICVAASDQRDRLATFSNFGTVNVDVAAPGVNIWSALPGGSYGFKNGTSMAAPHVSGSAALLLSQTPTMTPVELYKALTVYADSKPWLIGKTLGGGRLNVFHSLAQSGKEIL